MERMIEFGTPRLSLGFIPQTSLSELHGRLIAAQPELSLGFIPQTSLSADQRPALYRFDATVSGVHTPDFVERATGCAPHPSPSGCLWGSYPRLR